MFVTTTVHPPVLKRGTSLHFGSSWYFLFFPCQGFFFPSPVWGSKVICMDCKALWDKFLFVIWAIQIKKCLPSCKSKHLSIGYHSLSIWIYYGTLDSANHILFFIFLKFSVHENWLAQKLYFKNETESQIHFKYLLWFIFFSDVLFTLVIPKVFFVIG